jgi:acyl-CoA synthetase (AMP-forming)/AMP-acid ligase II
VGDKFGDKFGGEPGGIGSVPGPTARAGGSAVGGFVMMKLRVCLRRTPAPRRRDRRMGATMTAPTITDPTPDPRAEAAFLDLPSMLAEAARRHPQAPALIDGERRISHVELDATLDRVAAALHRDGLGPGDVVAIVAAPMAEYVFAFFGALRAGLAVAPLAPSSTPVQIMQMLADCEARIVFTDRHGVDALAGQPLPAPLAARPPRPVHLDGSQGAPSFDEWLAAPGARPRPVPIEPAWPFNLIYSSGTTGTPKGIVQSHAMRWAHIRRGSATGYGPGSVTLVATPLYSNTTLVALIPSLAWGGAVVLMRKFDSAEYLRLAERHHATHTMLVPVQYRRLLAHAEFDRTDLSSFVAKFCTSAPFHAELKAEVLRRWPGGLTEYYGLTEGGGTCILHCHLHPTKLHTVGPPSEGHDIRLVDAEGRELPPEAVRGGESGEIVGRSPAMMSGYHRQPGQTAEAEWFDAEGRRYIRHGDIGRFDADGFLVLTDRAKDMIISGGFNVYPSDLEAVLRQNRAVADVSVIGVPSEQWGEAPVACVVLCDGADPCLDGDALRAWANAQLGKTQRLAAVRLMSELPRSAIGKVLKRELREAWAREAG